jgi:signal transduction histidine kinase
METIGHNRSELRMVHGIDFRRRFEAVPGPYLVLSPDLTIVAASDGYVRATMTRRAAIVGRHWFAVFPDNPADRGATGARNLGASLRRVLELRVSDTMAVRKYDVRRPAASGGDFAEPYWSPINSPILDSEGRVAYFIHRAEDVTEVVRQTHRNLLSAAQAAALESRQLEMQAELYQRAQELQASTRQLHALRELAFGMLGAVDETEVCRIAAAALVDREMNFRLAYLYLVGPDSSGAPRARLGAAASRSALGDDGPETVAFDDRSPQPWPLSDVYRSRRAQWVQADVWVRPLGLQSASPSGVLVVGAPRGHTENRVSESFLELVGHQLSAAVAQAAGQRRERQRTAALAVARNRKRIAMDLHDGVIQTLHSVARKLAAEGAGPGADDERRGRLGQLRNQVNIPIRGLSAYVMEAEALQPASQSSEPADGLRAPLDAQRGNGTYRVEVQPRPRSWQHRRVADTQAAGCKRVPATGAEHRLLGQPRWTNFGRCPPC